MHHFIRCTISHQKKIATPVLYIRNLNMIDFNHKKIIKKNKFILNDLIIITNYLEKCVV